MPNMPDTRGQPCKPFNVPFSRRAMIRDGLLAVSAGMVMPTIFSRAVRAASNAAHEGAHWAQAAQGRTLIVVQMAGGNDGHRPGGRATPRRPARAASLAQGADANVAAGPSGRYRRRRLS